MVQNPTLHLDSFDKYVIDGTEYTILGRTAFDMLCVKREGGTREMNLHIDEIGRRIDQAEEVKLIKEEE